ncbi:hypothetical protein ONZ45_g7341 [Pleurotus djamor]|nr:hypothetical protein ONZ45_g7341 [Pleurotus djamor]
MGTSDVLTWAVFTTLAVFLAGRVLAYNAAKKRVSDLPGQRPLFATTSPLGALLPTSRFHPGLSWQWLWRHQGAHIFVIVKYDRLTRGFPRLSILHPVYERYGSETISQLALLGGGPTIYTSSMEAAKQIVSTKGQFTKSDASIALVKVWGKNVFTENGNEWKRQRRILAPAFTNKTYALVCQETSSTYQEMSSAEGWDDAKVVDIPSASVITSKLAMILISRCGFGSPLEWNFDKASQGEMNFAQALGIASSSLIARLIIPTWMYRLPIARLREMDTAYQIAGKFMRDLIVSRKRDVHIGLDTERNDILSLLINASEAEGKLGMDHEELMGNTFLLLFAGQDTTARTLDATLGFLALYEEIQQEVYEQIIDTIRDGLVPTLEDTQKLFKIEACFLEAARLFPAVPMFSRQTSEDLVLPIYDSDGLKDQLAVPADTEVVVDVVGMMYNPRHFPEPEEFRPSRWYGAHENDLAMFSVGPRACIGKRFAMTEAITFLALLLRDWKIEAPLAPGETKDQWRGRVMKSHMELTMGVGKVPIRMVRR